MKWTKRTMGLLLILLLAFTGSAVQAEESPVGFYVMPILPDNQFGDGVGYFSLLVKPEQEQTLKVLIQNLNDVEIQVAVEANTAFTNQNGVIEYRHSEQKDPTLVIDFEQCVTIDEPLLTIPANGSVTAEFHLQMPDQAFEGDMLGGFLFTRIPDEIEDGEESDEEVAQDDVQIKSVYMYGVAVRITQSEQPVTPNFEVIAAKMGTVAGFPALMLDMRNPQPLIASGVEMDVQVFPEDGEAPVLSFTSKISMAPNTAMPYSRIIKDEVPLEAGDYRVEVKLSYDGQTWAHEIPLIVE